MNISVVEKAQSLILPMVAGPRQIELVTTGRSHGPLTRLVSPSDIGPLIKPFVLLDHFRIQPTTQPLFGIHPHSGLATLTTVLNGEMRYAETTGQSGVVTTGGVEWMKAGNGVWHEGGPVGKETLQGFQLWVALPPGQENAPSESQYIEATSVPEVGPVRVILGRYGEAVSPIRAPTGIHYYHVRLHRGETWRNVTAPGHTVAWLAVDSGRLLAPALVESGNLAVFKEGPQAVELHAEEDTSFVFGSAIKHPYPLVLGYYSVHTSPEALERGEAEILRIGAALRNQGRSSRALEQLVSSPR